MGAGPFFPRSVALGALLLGVLGCEDRLRPEFGGLGNGIGPLSEVTTPAELDTVSRGISFQFGVRIEDDDGVDSFWVAPLDPLMDTLRFSGSGETTVLALVDLTVPGPSTADTLTINVFGVDIMGDTGVVASRHLLVQ